MYNVLVVYFSFMHTAYQMQQMMNNSISIFTVLLVTVSPVTLMFKLEINISYYRHIPSHLVAMKI